ncbi:MAG TPA: phosphomannomutase/phosphoglucomutase, partial [Patescibacteria group bacterium]|nr:phosphomannomutase/phosphoglucomutase [Patescibacteria group bacterium]
KLVVAEKADLGFMFDGDGDRFFVIDDRGKFVSGDFLTALLGKYLLEKHPRSKIIYDIRASWVVPDLIEENGGTSLFERVGHAFIKRRMADENALFAGEITGHYYHRDFNYSDSGLISSLLVLEMLSRKKVKMSDLLKPLEKKYFISGEINSKVADPAAKIRQLTKKYKDGRQNMLDGITVFYKDWHFNVRPSNTEALLRLNLEAVSKELMEQKRDEMLSIIRSS